MGVSVSPSHSPSPSGYVRKMSSSNPAGSIKRRPRRLRLSPRRGSQRAGAAVVERVCTAISERLSPVPEPPPQGGREKDSETRLVTVPSPLEGEGQSEG